jgi:hypothetical protein
MAQTKLPVSNLNDDVLTVLQNKGVAVAACGQYQHDCRIWRCRLLLNSSHGVNMMTSSILSC